MTGNSLLTVESLAVEYPSNRLRRPPTRVVHDVDFTIGVHETLALVGESGSGKTTIGKAILGLAPLAAGHIWLDGRDISTIGRKERRALAVDLQAVFQNPYGSLNPSMRVGQILAEPLFADGSVSKSDALATIRRLLERVGMPGDSVTRYPANFSGGQRQRIAIARAVARTPRLIVCDEPTSALDVTTQAAALDLLTELQETLGVSYLFITHDLAVVKEFADRAIVLREGTVVESGTSEQICLRPVHPYTQRLLAAAPVPDPRLQRKRRAARLQLAADSPIHLPDDQAR
ncbi:ATP-binding cassette domain-containing protein [Subtercola frigoramans]|uniref:Peptide/nickel transport system ATP-binding protein n=1 Tax=Subtercola frigoramans TaxID=120298 RepID=A0ABS2L116_9MICO|nr:ATP-binding cassette domain-containing protein [Subtercola frigoramans]MBM7470763.1 peptide/nickel transport system ATP-binding protein [Subtercola frigoramans]